MRNIFFLIILFSFAFSSNQTIISQDIISDRTLRRIPVPILMYHYVSPLPEDADAIRTELTIHPQLFREHVRFLIQEGYSIISLYEIYNALSVGANLPQHPIVLTFDDGYADHFEYVFPVLQEFNVSGTFFVITDFIDQRNPNHLTWEQAQEMIDGGMFIEAHTKTHPNLSERDLNFLVYQILGSIESIEENTGQRPAMFAYPAGRYDNNTLNVLSSTDIQLAVTTQRGIYHTLDERLELSRLRISGNMSVAGLANILGNTP